MNIAVCHPSPAIRRALADGLVGVGIEASEGPADISKWLDSHTPAGVVLPLRDDAWLALRRDFPGSLLIALVDEDSPQEYAKALAGRATAVACTSWEVERMVHTVQDAIEGFSTLPVEVARAMAARTEGPPTDLALSRTEAEALRLLCRGETVVAISDQLAYSQREMHRILGGLYERMGADHRAQAIVCATKWGLCDP